jgi:hypothetical protein
VFTYNSVQIPDQFCERNEKKNKKNGSSWLSFQGPEKGKARGINLQRGVLKTEFYMSTSIGDFDSSTFTRIA